MTDYKKLCEDLYDLSDGSGVNIYRCTRYIIATCCAADAIEELQAENERLKKQLYETVTDRNALKKRLDAALSRMLKMAIEIKQLRGEEGKA